MQYTFYVEIAGCKLIISVAGWGDKQEYIALVFGLQFDFGTLTGRNRLPTQARDPTNFVGTVIPTKLIGGDYFI